jgi:hypothetical protein
MHLKFEIASPNYFAKTSEAFFKFLLYIVRGLVSCISVTAETCMRKYMGISFAEMEHRAPLHLAYRFVSEKLLNPTNQVDPFYIAKFDISKIITFKGAILKFKIFWQTLVQT